MADRARWLSRTIARSLGQFRVVGLVGPRQVGKSTLAATFPGRALVTLDDPGVLDAASRDPMGFVAALPRPATIDEVQRAPSLLLAIKAHVDRDPAPGAFLLTGSSRLDTIRGLRDSLAGRIAIHRLWPMTRGEIEGAIEESPVERVFSCKSAAEAALRFASIAPHGPITPTDIRAGGFPEPVLRLDEAGRTAWFREYRRSVLERDIPAVLRVEDVPALARFVVAVSCTTGKTVNTTDLARDVGISVDTARRWLGTLETTFLADRLYPYWKNVRKRLAKTPKLFVCDSGLAAAVLGIENWDALSPDPSAGALLETWVHAQLAPLCDSGERHVELFFYRDHAGGEVDFVLRRGGRCIPIEVKTGATVRSEDARGIVRFRETVGDSCPFGVVLYGGDAVFPVASHAIAIPLSVFFDSSKRAS